jgi:hypothetical protein
MKQLLQHPWGLFVKYMKLKYCNKTSEYLGEEWVHLAAKQ